MTGRARGRGAGRGRARNVDSEAARRPGEEPNQPRKAIEEGEPSASTGQREDLEATGSNTTSTSFPTGRGRAVPRGVDGRRVPAETSTNQVARQLQRMSIENRNLSNQANAPIPGDVNATTSAGEVPSQRSAWFKNQKDQGNSGQERPCSGDGYPPIQQKGRYDEQGARPKERQGDYNQRLVSDREVGDGNRPNHQNQGYQQQGARPKEITPFSKADVELRDGREEPNGTRSRESQFSRPRSDNGEDQGMIRGDRDSENNRNTEVKRFMPETYTVKKGSSGKAVQVLANAFRFGTTGEEFLLYQYHVVFNPPVDSKKVRHAMLADHKELLGDMRAFDGMILYMPLRLQQEVTEVYSILRHDDTQVRLTITLVKELPPNSADSIQIYNIIFKRVQKMLGNEQIGRNYFNPSNATKYPQYGIDIMPGYLAAIQKFEAGNLIIVDVAHKLVQTENVLTKMYQMYELYRNNDVRFWDECLRQFVGNIVITKYNNKTYQIDDIDQDARPTHTFQLHNGDQISYTDYYMKHYGIKIEDMDQPLLVSRPKKKDIRTGRKDPIMLLPELCFITGFTPEMNSDFRMKASVQALTRVVPNQRVSNLQKFSQQMISNQEVQTVMNQWNLRIPNNPLALQGRQLDKESIFQRNVEIEYNQNSCDWSRGMRSNILTTPVSISNWIIIFWKKNLTEAKDIVHALTTVGPPMGMNYRQPQRIELADDRNMSYISALKQSVTPNTQLAMIILPSPNEDRYNAVKKLCCVEHPVPSQVVLKKTLARKDQLLSVATKISMQLNCKLGGELWTTRMPKVTGGLMIIGMDIYHAKDKKSVGGFVCSLNQACTRYSSGALFQMQRQEILDGLAVKMAEGLKRYHGENGTLPAKIVVYRDGVGDGQLDIVLDHEVKQLKDCCHSFANYEPKMAVIIVKKRIGQRFFIRNGPTYDNPKPGTIVDTGVTKNEWADFYLVSQSVRQGTVSPTHYNIIHDSIDIGVDQLQKLTYKLCHLYYNWQGTIRVPAPCQYAHKLAYLVGQNLRKDPHPALTDRLFFL